MILKISMINAGNDFFNGSLTFMCIHTAPSIIIEMIRAAGKTRKGFHSPKINSRAAVILMNPMT
jgi:hypothetical protein